MCVCITRRNGRELPKLCPERGIRRRLIYRRSHLPWSHAAPARLRSCGARALRSLLPPASGCHGERMPCSQFHFECDAACPYHRLRAAMELRDRARMQGPTSELAGAVACLLHMKWGCESQVPTSVQTNPPARCRGRPRSHLSAMATGLGVYKPYDIAGQVVLVTGGLRPPSGAGCGPRELLRLRAINCQRIESNQRAQLPDWLLGQLPAPAMHLASSGSPP